jgi:hypothetical protein
MASLALDHEQRPVPERTARAAGELIDARAISAELEQVEK